MSILDRIDDTLDDWNGSGDAMRWRPEVEQESGSGWRGASAPVQIIDEAFEFADADHFRRLFWHNAATTAPRPLGFAEQIERLATQAGESQADVDRISRGILAMASTNAGVMTETINRAARAQYDAQLSGAYRRAQSGPNKFERQIARVFGLPIALLLPTRPSALDARYHRRYRNRKGRR